MVFCDRYPQKTRYCGGRERNIWYKVYRCPVCGVTARRLQNTSRHLTMTCDGATQRGSRKKD